MSLQRFVIGVDHRLYPDDEDGIWMEADEVDKVLAAKDATISQLRTAGEEIQKYRHAPAFGMQMREGESLYDAASRWYEEFDEVRAAQAARIAELEAALDKLPKTADDIPAVPDMELFLPGYRGAGEVNPGMTVNDSRYWPDASGESPESRISECYSTREAAEAALAKGKPEYKPSELPRGSDSDDPMRSGVDGAGDTE